MKIYSVSQVTRAISRQIEEAQAKAGGSFWMEGEISDWKLYGTKGDAYFTVKDGESVMSCIAWAGILNKLPATARQRLGDKTYFFGKMVRLFGSVILNKKRGQYSFQAKDLKIDDALGELMIKFQEMKSRLEKEGLFAHSASPRKRPLLVHRIGIVTSKSGAVIHDICVTAVKRYPDIQLRLYPVKVQGDGAAEEIAKGVRYFNNLVNWRPDVLIVARGGGSMEDLWAFNEEVVVRAVHASRIPVISAVGHQTDFTLCDFAADYRAGTPSIAAEQAVPVKIELADRVRKCESQVNMAFKACWHKSKLTFKNLAQRLSTAPGVRLADLTSRLESAKAKLPHLPEKHIALMENRLIAATMRLGPALDEALADAASRVQTAKLRLGPALDGALADAASRVQAARLRLPHSIEASLSQNSGRLAMLQAKLAPAAEKRITAAEHRLSAAAQKLELLSPLATLERGYSITFGADGKVLKSVSGVRPGDKIETRLADGNIVSTV